ncbi:MAG TPA: polysaccharide biosynthesis tyrosine autokinase [Chitinophagaceae bacterium]|nr:polysaccharide biosynthesis tyrosine autokinase [Chitinophagaceae bacterium]
MEEQLQTEKSELNSLSVKDLFFKYIRFIPWFIISLALALIVAYTYLRYATPVYSSAGTLLIKTDEPSTSDEKLQQLFLTDENQNIQNEMEVLRSRGLLERVVRKLHLETGYMAQGSIRSSNVYKQVPFQLDIFEIADSSRAFSLDIVFDSDSTFTVNGGDQHFKYGALFENSNGVFRLSKIAEGGGKEYVVSWQPARSVAAGLANSLVVGLKTPGTGILLISMEATNPRLAADVINGLMREYEVATIEDKNTNVSNILSFIDVRLDTLNHELDSIQKALLTYREQNNLIDVPTQSTAYFTQTTAVDDQINQQNLQLDLVNLVDQYLRDAQKKYSLVPSSLGLQDPTLNALIQSYNTLEFERKALLDGGTPPGNLVVKQKEEQLEKLRSSLLENLKNIRGAYQQAISELEKKSSFAQSEFRSLPKKAREMLEIQRQADSKLTLANYLMEKREETAISKASTISNSKILEEADVNSIPVKPNRRTVQLFAVLIGLAIPALVIFIIEISNDKVTTRSDIERITAAPILGEVGHSFSGETLVATSTSRGMVAEQFRIIRSNLQYIIGSLAKPTILTTSSFSGEGKSFISTNIGAVMALAGKKTVVLEFDIRKPKIMAGLGLQQHTGITQYLLGRAQAADLPVAVPGYENFYVIACGPVPPNPAELLLEKRVAELFAWLKEHFDVILIDTAPVGMVSDALTLAQFADATLYIVRQGHTFKKQVGLIDELYVQQKLPKLSVIINDVKLKAGYGYYGYGRYGYGYGYGESYYAEETPLPSFRQRLFGWLNPFGRKKKRR